MSRTTTENVASLTTGHAVLPRVNLLPPEVQTARRLRKVQAGLGAGVAVVAVLIGGVYLLQTQSVNSAQDQLDQSKARATTLQAQKAQYADVPRTLSAIDAAETARQNALATDVLWYRYLNDLSYVTPKNAWLSTLDIGLNTGGVTALNPVAHTGIATVTVTGVAKQHNDVAAWLVAAAKESGWNDAYFSNSEVQADNGTTTVKFSSTANVTADALSHRYDRKAG